MYHKSNTTNLLLWPLLALGILIIVGIAVWLLFIRPFVGDNRAEEVAKPIEQALLEAGAIKQCSRGGSGYSISNTTPWWEAYYTLNTGKTKAIETINKIASDNGFTLKHASPTNRGPLTSLRDEYLDAWYFDTGKMSTFSDLKDGNIELMMTVNASGTDTTCGTTLTVDDDNSVISVEVRMPQTKR